MAPTDFLWYIFVIEAAITLLLGVFGLVLLLTAEEKKPSDMMLAHLTVCNMLNVTMYMALSIFNSFGEDDKLNHILIDLTFAIYIPHVLTLVIITIDRILAVHLVLRYRSVVTNGRLKLVLTLVWILGAVYGVLSSLFENLKYVSLCLSAIVVMFFIVSYLFIIFKVQTAKKNMPTVRHKSRFKYWIPLTIIVTYTLLVVATDISVIIIKTENIKLWHYIAWSLNALIDTLTYLFGSAQIKSRIKLKRGALLNFMSKFHPRSERNNLQEKENVQMAVIQNYQKGLDTHL